MSKKILSLNNLNVTSFSRGKKFIILKNITLDLIENEILGVVGESGSGKTTLARFLLGVLNPEEMRISAHKYLIDNVEINVLSNDIDKLRGSFVNMVMQDPVSSLSSTMVIGEHFRMVLRDVSNVKIKSKQDFLIMKVLKDLGLDNYVDIIRQYPLELSVGMSQRVNIALSIISKPKILILDEPTSSVDEKNREKILQLLNNFVKNNKMSLVIITHDILSAIKICDRVLVMKKGIIVDSFLGNKSNFKHKYVSQLYKSALLKGGVSKNKKNSQILVELNNVSKNFGSKEVLNNFSMTLKKGETLGIIGDSGSGKTTISKLIMGIYKPSNGVVKIKKSLKIEIIFQNANMALNHNQKIFNILNEQNYINKKEEYSEELINSYFKDFNLSDSVLGKYVTGLSEGQKQIIAIVRSLLTGPDVIILDEPTSSLDSVSQKKILDLLIKTKEKYGLTYILISHNQRVINYMCDRYIYL